MINLEKIGIEKLLAIVPPHPAIRIAHFSNNDTLLSSVLGNFCQEKEYELLIHCVGNKHFDFISKDYDSVDSVSVVNFSLDRPRYMMQGKQYDFVFVTLSDDVEDIGSFLKKVHGIIKNAGNIILFMEKDNASKRHHWIQRLEENYYVASSTIDDLFKGCDVVISKKMHGWGG